MARKQARVAVVTDAAVTDDVVTVVEQSAPHGWTMIDEGTDQDAPEVVAHVSADVADAFGLGGLVEAGLAVVTDHAAVVEGDGGEWLTDENIAALTQPPVAVPEVADIVLRLPGLLTETAAAQMAAFFAGKLGQPIELARAGVVIDTVFPGRARAAAMPRATRTEGASNGNLGRAMALLGGSPQSSAATYDWSTFDAVERWGNNPAPYAQAYVRQCQAIHEQAERQDLDALRGYSFAGSKDEASGNSFQKTVGKYLRAKIARVEAARQDEANRITAQFEARMARAN